LSAGIDTVSLQLHEYKVKKSAPLDVWPAIIQHDSGKLRGDYTLFLSNETGQPVTGQKATYNGDFLNKPS